MENLFLGLAAAAMIATALLHSIAGELRLIRPLLASEAKIMRTSSLARKVLRFAWHLTSLMWIVFALFLIRPLWGDVALDGDYVLAVGILHLAVGLFDAVYTRGKHLGWPPLTAVGVFCLLALA